MRTAESYRRTVSFAAWMLLAAGARAEGLANRVDEYINAHLKTGQFTGSILIAREGRVLMSKGYGMANREHDVPNSPQTRFRLGSISKQFTAVAILQLQERGLLSVQDSVYRYVADAPEAWRRITIHHLLTHTSGIPNFTSLPDYTRTKSLPSTILQTITRFKDRPQEFEPGEKYAYSNSGYVVLAYIIEKVSGIAYEAFVTQNIFGPLKMLGSGQDSAGALIKHRAAGYSRRGGEVVNAPYLDMSIQTGCGSLYSTVEDLFLWDQALYTEKLLSKKSLEAMFTPFKENYAYGWGIANQFNRRLVAHGGFSEGFSSFIARYPDEKVFIAVLSNLETAATSTIARDLAAMLFGEKYEIPTERTQITLDPNLYDAYVGRYELHPDIVLTVMREGDRLLAQATGQPKVEIFPESHMKFFAKFVDAQITFVKDAAGQVSGLIVHLGGRDLPARKLGN